MMPVRTNRPRCCCSSFNKLEAISFFLLSLLLSRISKQSNSFRIIARPCYARSRTKPDINGHCYFRSGRSSKTATSVRFPRSSSSSLRALFRGRIENDNTEDIVKETLRKCAFERSVGSGEVIEALEYLEKSEQEEQKPIPNNRIRREDVSGAFELVFSSAVARIPVVGGWLDGYLPNKETIDFDIDGSRTLLLRVETLPPFLPAIDIVGENLRWNAGSSSLTYQIKGKEEESSWKILYADETLVAAKSSVTGLNVIRRI